MQVTDPPLWLVLLVVQIIFQYQYHKSGPAIHTRAASGDPSKPLLFPWLWLHQYSQYFICVPNTEMCKYVYQYTLTSLPLLYLSSMQVVT